MTWNLWIIVVRNRNGSTSIDKAVLNPGEAHKVESTLVELEAQDRIQGYSMLDLNEAETLDYSDVFAKLEKL